MPKQKYFFLWFSAICVVAFILQTFIPGFTEQLMLSEQAISKPWQFLTAIFLHGSIAHLIYNLFALLIFGFILEQIIGSKKFMLLFLISGTLVNFVSFFWFPNALGASGAIMAILGALTILRPLMSVWAFGMIIPMFIAAILWAVGSILGIFGFGEQGIGHLAHLLGIFFGLCYGIYLKLKYRNKKQVVFERKIVIPENYMRNWEDSNLKDN